MLSVVKYIREWERKNPTETIPGRADMRSEEACIDIVAPNHSDCRFFDKKLYASSSFTSDTEVDLSFYPEQLDGKFDLELALCIVDALLSQAHKEILEHGLNEEKERDVNPVTFVAHDMLCDIRKKIYALKDFDDYSLTFDEDLSSVSA